MSVARGAWEAQQKAEKIQRILRVYWGLCCSCDQDETCVECDPV